MENDLIVYFNGKFVKKQQVCISPDDRGFLMADGLYDVMRFFNKKIFYLNQHLQRIEHSLKELRIHTDIILKLESVANTLLAENGFQPGDNILLYVQVTRGAYNRTHSFPPASVKPTEYISVYKAHPDYKGMENGVKVITTDDIRWGRCDIKTIALTANILAKQQAVENNAYDAVFLKNGIVTEGSHTGVFGVKDNQVITHPRTSQILPSITRGVVNDLCRNLDIEIVEKQLYRKHLQELDEMFLVGTITEIMPVTKVDDMLIGKGSPGAVTKKIQQAFRKLVQNY